MSIACFIDPVDVLYIRGNRLFGGAGEHGEALMPPWPSVASGAIRSHVLVRHDVPLEDYAMGLEGLLKDDLAVLGTPAEPGSFRLRWFSPAVREAEELRPFLPLPQDVFLADDDKAEPVMLHPAKLPDGVASSAPLEKLALLKTDRPAKPKKGMWLNAEGIARWVAGQPISRRDIADSGTLYKLDPRLGIARDIATGSVEEGKLYTSETVAFCRDLHEQEGMTAGFLALVEGADAAIVHDGLLRFGGDGRAARLNKNVDWQPPEPDDVAWQRIEQEKACRLMLVTPGLLPDGWRLPGMQDDGTWRGPAGLTGRVAAAAVARAQVVSGWDLTALTDPRRRNKERRAPGTGHPKPAQRAVPVGSVYWLEGLEGDIRGGLEKLLQEGLWACLPGDEWDRTMANWRQRRAEGFNNVLIGAPAAKN